MSRGIQNPVSRRPGFTLTELLIVMGIMVLVAIIAVPSFRALTGGRSTEAAQNQLAAFLQRARQEAIGVQEIRGVAFIRSTDTGRPTAIVVREVGPPTNPPDTVFATAEVYLDAVPDRDQFVLPAGVGIQMVDDCVVTPPNAARTPDPGDDVRADDAYIGMNSSTVNMPGAPGDTNFFYGGVILFDGFGRVVSKEYAFKCFTRQPAITGTKKLSEIASLWKMTGMTDFKPGRTGQPAVRSGFGFVLFDQDAFDNLGYTPGDPQLDAAVDGGAYADASEASGGTGRSQEAQEERWLDANAVPVLVNRNNGTLVRGQ